MRTTLLCILLGVLALPALVKAELVDVYISGRAGYHTYRIPSLIISPDGTLLAFAEGRKGGQGDSGSIDVVLRRSTDGGRSWGGMQVVASDPPNTMGNPCPVVDRSTGAIWLLLTRNLGRDTEHAIMSQTAQGTREVWITSSRDNGLTWAKPANITATAKDSSWTWYATGPGIGIQLTSGRLLIPCDNAVAGSRAYQSHVIYSDDHGQTWNIGGTLGPRVNECQAAELSDGSVLLNMRSYRGKQCRATAVSKDGGLTWSAISDAPALIEPVCQASLLRYPGDADHRPCLLFANPADESRRAKMTLRISPDDGRTWPVSKMIYPGPAAYSCLAILPDRTILCLFERDDYQRISLARIPMD